MFEGAKKIIKKIELRFSHIIIPTFLSLSAAIFDGLSKTLIIPLIQGMVSMDFGFVKEAPVLKTIITIIPSSFGNFNIRIFSLLVILIFIASIIHHILSYFADFVLAYRIRKYSNNLRKAIFDRYLTFGKLFFDKTNFGYLSSLLIEFTDFIADSMIGILAIFTEFFRIAIYLIILFLISWKLTAFVLVTFPILYFALTWFIKKINETSQILALSREELNKKAFNVLSNIALVKSYTSENDERESFSQLSEAREKLEFSIDKKQSFVKPLQEFFMITGLLFLILAIAFITMKNPSSRFSGFLVYLYLLRGGMTSFGALNHFRARVAALSGTTKEVLKIFDDGDKYFVTDGRKKLTGLKDAIEFKNLNFSYIKERPVLKNISFSVKKGEITALVGPTGSGKTTIIHLLMRFYDCLPQSIIIDGTDIRDFTLESLRRHMALVSQETLLFNDTIKDNIAYGLDNVNGESLISSLKKARLYDFVMQLPEGLNTLIGDKGVKLSGGEKQRVSIARALLKEAEILILDEATSSLDTRTEKLIQGAIEEAVKGRTTIVIAHRLSTIKNADKIVVIENGTILEQGPLNELLNKKGKFYQYWEEQKFY